MSLVPGGGGGGGGGGGSGGAMVLGKLPAPGVLQFGLQYGRGLLRLQ